MKLKSFGCSFIFGSELSDDGCNGLYAKGSRLTWPALLANELGYDYQTYARPGSGNLQIMENILIQASDPVPAFFVIGWTWIDRFDFVSDLATSWTGGTKWKTLMPVEDSTLAQTYYKDFHSEYRDKLTNLIYIKNAIDCLREKNLNFIMTYMDDLLFDNKWNTSNAVADLQSQVKPYMLKFEGLNFLDWSKLNGFSVGPALHPMEEAHQAAANYMLELGVHKV
jgi:hypothetical protein